MFGQTQPNHRYLLAARHGRRPLPDGLRDSVLFLLTRGMRMGNFTRPAALAGEAVLAAAGIASAEGRETPTIVALTGG